jgi:hypothetical protein
VEEALGWTALAASSLVIGGLLGLARHWPNRSVGLVLAFGAGALISAVSFDLAQEGARIGGPGYVALGLAGGAITYFVASRQLDRKGGGGTDLALGALLDGIPEQMVLGIGIATGDGVVVGLLVAIFVSNLPESIGASDDLRAAGHSPRDPLDLDRDRRGLHARRSRGLRARRRGLGWLPGRHQRLRCRRAARDARRLDDSGGAAEGGHARRSHLRARLRRRGRPLRPVVVRLARYSATVMAAGIVVSIYACRAVFGDTATAARARRTGNPTRRPRSSSHSFRRRAPMLLRIVTTGLLLNIACS